MWLSNTGNCLMEVTAWAVNVFLTLTSSVPIQWVENPAPLVIDNTLSPFTKDLTLSPTSETIPVTSFPSKNTLNMITVYHGYTTLTVSHQRGRGSRVPNWPQILHKNNDWHKMRTNCYFNCYINKFKKKIFFCKIIICKFLLWYIATVAYCQNIAWSERWQYNEGVPTVLDIEPEKN